MKWRTKGDILYTQLNNTQLMLYSPTGDPGGLQIFHQGEAVEFDYNTEPCAKQILNICLLFVFRITLWSRMIYCQRVIVHELQRLHVGLK